jgi:predicted DCC family thiol-disulfide oxidoreductase YuxK
VAPLFRHTPREPYVYRSDPAVPPFPDDRPLIVFDGYCGLCSRLVQFVLRHDRKRVHRLLAAQTPLGDALYNHFGLTVGDYETFIVIADGKAYFASEAGLVLFRALGAPWSWLYPLIVVPSGIRDRIYLWIAHNRMRFFGRTDTCYLPGPEHADRFL